MWGFVQGVFHFNNYSTCLRASGLDCYQFNKGRRLYLHSSMSVFFKIFNIDYSFVNWFQIIFSYTVLKIISESFCGTFVVLNLPSKHKHTQYFFSSIQYYDLQESIQRENWSSSKIINSFKFMYTYVHFMMSIHLIFFHAFDFLLEFLKVFIGN